MVQITSPQSNRGIQWVVSEEGDLNTARLQWNKFGITNWQQLVWGGGSPNGAVNLMTQRNTMEVGQHSRT